MIDLFVPNVACVVTVLNVACEHLRPDGSRSVLNVACTRDLRYIFPLSLYFHDFPLFRARVSHKRHSGLKSSASGIAGARVQVLRVRDSRALPHNHTWFGDVR